ncbi:MAG: LLM class oxidoreductase [Pseudomonadota bacterium]
MNLPLSKPSECPFSRINAGYDSVFQRDRLSIGLVVPLENYERSAIPEMEHHVQRVQLAEDLGFSAIWLRDVPFDVPSFGDAGQLFDPFVYLGSLAAQTSRIALGVASVILPLRHPAHVAKAAATADAFSNGRLILGVASGDRPEEYPAINVPYELRGELFRESYDYIRNVGEDSPTFKNVRGEVRGGINMLPKPHGARLPLLITGSSQQSNEWIATNGDGWMTYPRPANIQAQLIATFRASSEAAGHVSKPVMEPLYVDVADDVDAQPTPIHLGIRTGINRLRDYLRARQKIGVNHVALNLRFNNAPIESTLALLADEILPEFSN